MSLTFKEFRAKNVERLALHKNRKGEYSHSKKDGSDWILAQWSNAVAGEVGELANMIKKIDRGDYTLEEIKSELSDEVADIFTYLDILAFRMGMDLDKVLIEKFNKVSDKCGCDIKLGSSEIREINIRKNYEELLKK